MVIFLLKFTSLKFLSVIIVAILFLMIFLNENGMAESLPKLSDMKITLNKNLISVDIVDTPLIEVLNHIEKETGIEGHFLGNLRGLITISFSPVSFEKGMKNLVGKNSISFVYKDLKTGHSIAEIWVIDGSGPGESLSYIDVHGHIDSQQEINTKTTGNLSSLNENLQELVKQGDAEAVMSIAAQFGNVSVEVRELLVDAIGLIHNEHSIQILGQILYGDSEPQIRMMAIRYLAERIEEPAAKALIEGATGDPDDAVRLLVEQLLEGNK